MPTAPTQERLKELLHLDPDKGVLTWRVDRTRGVKAGDVAGRIGHDGYKRLTVAGWSTKASIVIWLYMTGEHPKRGVDVDHCNGNKLDDRWCNLRRIPHSDNLCNAPLKDANTSGFRGVIKSGKRFKAQISIDGSTVGLGTRDTEEEASQLYEAAFKEGHTKYKYPNRGAK